MKILYPKQLLHAEGAAVLAAATVLYGRIDGSWWLFALLFFAPDLAMVGYMASGRIGAIVYNVAHNFAVPLALGVVGVVADADLAVHIALIWTAHIGFDRLLGYGLKYPDGFKETHLGRVSFPAAEGVPGATCWDTCGPGNGAMSPVSRESWPAMAGR